jgi:AAA ATPase domain
MIGGGGSGGGGRRRRRRRGPQPDHRAASSGRRVAAGYETPSPFGTYVTGMWTVDRPPQWVGRGQELAVLRAGVEALGRGEGAVVWVEGEPGIGKSSLVAEALAAGGGPGWDVGWGRRCARASRPERRARLRPVASPPPRDLSSYDDCPPATPRVRWTYVQRGSQPAAINRRAPAADRPRRSRRPPRPRVGAAGDDHFGSGRQRKDVAAARLGRTRRPGPPTRRRAGAP